MSDEDLGFVPIAVAKAAVKIEDDGLGFVPVPTKTERVIAAGKEAGQEYGPILAKAAGYAMDPMAAVGDAGQWAVENPEKAYEYGGPWLPTAGAVLGTGLAPGIGTAAGAGLGEIARQGAGIVFGDPNTPRTAGDAAKNAMGQTALGGFDRVSSLVRAAPAAKPYVQRGIEAVGRGIAPVGKAVKEYAAGAAEVMTGVPARQGVKLIEEPSRLVKGIGQLDSLGEKVGAAEAVSEAGLSPSIRAKIVTNEKDAANKIVSKLLEKKYTNPEAITPIEATAGMKAIDATFPNRTEKNGKIIQEYSDLRSMLSDIQSKADPNLASAKAAFHDAKVGGSFRNLFRQTKSGGTSAVPFLSFLVNPTNWGGGEAVRQAAKLPLFSPIAYGTAMAGGSAAIKGVGAIVESPTARQALISRYITSREDR